MEDQLNYQIARHIYLKKKVQINLYCTVYHGSTTMTQYETINPLAVMEKEYKRNVLNYTYLKDKTTWFQQI